MYRYIIVYMNYSNELVEYPIMANSYFEAVEKFGKETKFLFRIVNVIRAS